MFAILDVNEIFYLYLLIKFNSKRVFKIAILFKTTPNKISCSIFIDINQMNNNLIDENSSSIETQTVNLEKNQEESLVLIQFTDLDDANYCQQFSNKFKNIDIESKNPIIQIGNRLYTGEYINNIGTYLFFEEQNSTTKSTASSTADKDKTVEDKERNDANSTEQLDSSEQNNYHCFGKSFKKLVLTRLFVEEKIIKLTKNEFPYQNKRC